ncbi:MULTISPECIES: PGF-pre-PGF domain-containing protein [unclassified Methanoregula]|uniref:PGF-pre-PGF domain-containing protein n=1 Tax=unclassified Methanoregula TaxID=2649730 RepID=UPI0009C8A0D4|nr:MULTISPECIES: PGF-pre-PGF domain-containing protein [unclassified Methanoregula]OPX64645.1 MAG: PKD domain protein [Methanoregula sp. PtaB.Bin085]OPY36013.1 MAG: PKD domain protein [Methanoregula sp. PtaU1.Bin006]
MHFVPLRPEPASERQQQSFCQLVCLPFIILLALAGPVAAADHTLNPGDPIGQNITDAAAGDTLILNPGTYREIDIIVSKDIIIRANTSCGGTAANTIIDTMASGRIFDNRGGYNLAIDNLSLKNGTHTESGGAIRQSGGTLAISSSIISSGSSTDGNAIYVVSSPLTVTSTTFSDCRSDNFPGAIFALSTTVRIENSTFSDCRSEKSTGAIDAILTTVRIENSTFSRCTGRLGGAVAVFRGPAIIISSTFTDCHASYRGGAIAFDESTLAITSSSFTRCSCPEGGAVWGGYDGGATIHFSRFSDCDSEGAAIYRYAGTWDVRNNWWGTNDDPSPHIYGPATYSPWLVLGAVANPSSVTPAQTASVTANLTYDNLGYYHDPVADGHVPDDILTVFTLTRGTGSLVPDAGGMVSGTNATTFMSPAGTMAMVNVTVDGESVGVPITVNGAAFTGSPISGTVPLSVQFTDASVGSPTMWNWSFGDGTWFNTTDTTAASPLHTYTSTGTYTVSLTASGAFGTTTQTRVGYITVVSPGTVPETTIDNRDNDDGFPSVTPAATEAGPFPLMTVTVNIGGDSKAWQAVVTGTKLSELIVTGTVQNSAGFNMTALPGIVFQYLRLEPARYGTITQARVNFTVPQSWLDENRIAPGSIVLYHMTADGGWKALPTTFLNTKDGTGFFSAESPGFSLFAIAGTPGTTAPAVMATQATAVIPVQELPEAGKAVPQKPVTTQTTAPPAATPQPALSSPVMTAILVIAAIGILAGGGFMVRRWWIRRQNPALFEEC